MDISCTGTWILLRGFSRLFHPVCQVIGSGCQRHHGGTDNQETQTDSHEYRRAQPFFGDSQLPQRYQRFSGSEKQIKYHGKN